MTTEKNDKPLILVADDDITARMLARECLEQSGFDVVVAENGKEAVDLFVSAKPNAVILDALMPEMDGYGACQKIQAIDGNRNVPIMMMTSLDDEGSIDKAYEAGVTDFTIKPVIWTIEVQRLRAMLKAAAVAQEIVLARQEWERTFNAFDEVITVHDKEGTIIQANDAASSFIGSSVDKLKGKRCHEIDWGHTHPEDACPMKHCLETGKAIGIEYENRLVGGTYLLSAFPVFDEGGNLVRVVHMEKNITEKKQFEAELSRAQKMDAIGTLAGGLAHDFNNLLQVIIGYSEVIGLALPPEDKTSKHLHEVKEAAWRGSEITRQLLTVSRRNKGDMQPLMINAAVESVLKLLERTLPKMVSMECRLSEDLHIVEADLGQIEQILMNLAINGSHAMDTEGALCFETRNIELDRSYCEHYPDVKPGPYVQVTVSDNGCGMDQETLDHIYEPFFTTKAPGKGTGLGLAMVYGIVQSHSGHMVCYSEKGVGTSFKIYLPAVLEGDAEDAKAKDEDDMQAVQGDETVLIVDDDSNIRYLAKKMLTGTGYRVLVAHDGQHAMDIYSALGKNIDIVILDLNMPIMGGLECLDLLQQRNSSVLVLLASGFALNKESSAKLSKTVDYINKPYHQKEFLLKLRGLLDGHDSKPDSHISPKVPQLT